MVSFKDTSSVCKSMSFCLSITLWRNFREHTINVKLSLTMKTCGSY